VQHCNPRNGFGRLFDQVFSRALDVHVPECSELDVRPILVALPDPDEREPTSGLATTSEPGKFLRAIRDDV
jgi:hypothetical protein